MHCPMSGQCAPISLPQMQIRVYPSNVPSVKAQMDVDDASGSKIVNKILKRAIKAGWLVKPKKAAN